VVRCLDVPRDRRPLKLLRVVIAYLPNTVEYIDAWSERRAAVWRVSLDFDQLRSNLFDTLPDGLLRTPRIC